MNYFSKFKVYIFNIILKEKYNFFIIFFSATIIIAIQEYFIINFFTLIAAAMLVTTIFTIINYFILSIITFISHLLQFLLHHLPLLHHSDSPHLHYLLLLHSLAHYSHLLPLLHPPPLRHPLLQSITSTITTFIFEFINSDHQYPTNFSQFFINSFFSFVWPKKLRGFYVDHFFFQFIILRFY